LLRTNGSDFFPHQQNDLPVWGQQRLYFYCFQQHDFPVGSSQSELAKLTVNTDTQADSNKPDTNKANSKNISGLGRQS
jgi:hypothetical protein